MENISLSKEMKKHIDEIIPNAINNIKLRFLMYLAHKIYNRHINEMEICRIEHYFNYFKTLNELKKTHIQKICVKL